MDEYNSFFDFCQSLTNIILVDDFDTHHIEWGCEHTDREEEALLCAAMEASFLCINDGSPTFPTRPGQRISAIDLTFIFSSIIGLCESTTLNLSCLLFLARLGCYIDAPIMVEYRSSLPAPWRSNTCQKTPDVNFFLLSTHFFELSCLQKAGGDF